MSSAAYAIWSRVSGRRPQSERWFDLESRTPKWDSTSADRPSPVRPSRRAAAIVSNRRGSAQPYSRFMHRTS